VRDGLRETASSCGDVDESALCLIDRLFVGDVLLRGLISAAGALGEGLLTDRRLDDSLARSLAANGDGDVAMTEGRTAAPTDLGEGAHGAMQRIKT
jgi:hypothetical protein